MGKIIAPYFLSGDRLGYSLKKARFKYVKLKKNLRLSMREKNDLLAIQWNTY